jgi:hypothetical protein
MNNNKTNNRQQNQSPYFYTHKYIDNYYGVALRDSNGRIVVWGGDFAADDCYDKELAIDYCQRANNKMCQMKDVLIEGINDEGCDFRTLYIQALKLGYCPSYSMFEYEKMGDYFEEIRDDVMNFLFVNKNKIPYMNTSDCDCHFSAHVNSLNVGNFISTGNILSDWDGDNTWKYVEYFIDFNKNGAYRVDVYVWDAAPADRCFCKEDKEEAKREEERAMAESSIEFDRIFD